MITFFILLNVNWLINSSTEKIWTSTHGWCMDAIALNPVEAYCTDVIIYTVYSASFCICPDLETC